MYQPAYCTRRFLQYGIWAPLVSFASSIISGQHPPKTKLTHPAPVFKGSCASTVLGLLEPREVTEQIDQRQKCNQHVSRTSEDLKCWGAWDSSSGRKSQGHDTIDIPEERGTAKGSWWRPAVEKTTQGHCHAIRPTLELFPKLHWGTWKTGWSAYGISRALRHHLELNWTELHNYGLALCCHLTRKANAYISVNDEEEENKLGPQCWIVRHGMVVNQLVPSVE